MAQLASRGSDDSNESSASTAWSDYSSGDDARSVYGDARRHVTLNYRTEDQHVSSMATYLTEAAASSDEVFRSSGAQTSYLASIPFSASKEPWRHSYSQSAPYQTDSSNLISSDRSPEVSTSPAFTGTSIEVTQERQATSAASGHNGYTSTAPVSSHPSTFYQRLKALRPNARRRSGDSYSGSSVSSSGEDPEPSTGGSAATKDGLARATTAFRSSVASFFKLGPSQSRTNLSVSGSSFSSTSSNASSRRSIYRDPKARRPFARKRSNESFSGDSVSYSDDVPTNPEYYRNALSGRSSTVTSLFKSMISTSLPASSGVSARSSGPVTGGWGERARKFLPRRFTSAMPTPSGVSGRGGDDTSYMASTYGYDPSDRFPTVGTGAG